MGFIILLTNPQEWHRIYVQNCSFKTSEQWAEESPANVPLGVLYVFLGISFELLYLPFMIVMLKKEFIQHSCYKLMFLLSIIDMCVLPGNAIVSGIQSMLGLHFCHYPKLFFVVGAFATYGWYAASFLAVVLAFDRLVEMVKPNLAEYLFKGKAMIFWLAAPIAYFFWAWFNLPAFYCNKLLSFNFDPYAAIDGLHGNPEFSNIIFHTVHNIFISVSIGSIYLALCIILTIRAKVYKSANISRHQKLMTLQSVCICFEIFVAALVYIYNQFFYIPPIISAMAHVSWICMHGDTPIVYLCLNASLRKSVFKLIRNAVRRSPFSAINSIMAAPSYYHGSTERYQTNQRPTTTQQANQEANKF